MLLKGGRDIMERKIRRLRPVKVGIGPSWPIKSKSAFRFVGVGEFTLRGGRDYVFTRREELAREALRSASAYMPGVRREA